MKHAIPCFLTAISIFCNFAVADSPAQEIAIISANYKVTDGLKKLQTLQEWRVSIFDQPSTYYKIEKINSHTKKLVTSEVESYFKKLSHNLGQDFYMEQHLTQNPSTLEKDGKVFGRIEMRKLENDSLVQSWPAFGELEVRGDTHTFKLTVLVHEKGKVVLTKIFRKNFYHLPQFERQQLTGIDGTIHTDILYSRID